MALSCRPSCRISVLWGVLSAATQYPLILYHTYARKSRKMFMKAFSKFSSCRVRGCTVCTPPQWGVLSGHHTYCTQEHAAYAGRPVGRESAYIKKHTQHTQARSALRPAGSHPILYHIYAGMSILTQQKFYESVFIKKKKKKK